MKTGTNHHAPSRTWTAEETVAFMNTLRSQLREAGVFSGDKLGYIIRSIYVLILAALTLWGFTVADSWGARFAVAILGGYMGVQASAIGHEAGHGAVSRSGPWREFVGQFFMTLMLGNSYSGWVERHGTHHVHPNSRKDPDARPSIFSFNETDARNAKGVVNWFTRHQYIFVYPISTILAFNLKISSFRAVMQNARAKWLDLVLLIMHFLIWIGLPAIWVGLGTAVVNYMLLTWIEGAYLSAVFLCNHLGGPTSEEASEWPPALRQIVTARNLPTNALISHIFIGLNSHIEHHLFGHVPATRLHEARAITRNLCEAHGIPYRERSFREGFGEVHQYNRRMAKIADDAMQERATPLGGSANG